MKAKTQGISPKLIAAVVAAVVGYLLTQTVLNLPPWAVVAAQAVLVAIAAFAAPPGTVSPDSYIKGVVKKAASAKGLTLVEVLVVLILVIVILLILGVGVGHASYIKG